MSEIQSTNAMTFQNPPNPAEKSANDAVAGYSGRDFSKGAQPMLRRRFRLGESLVQGFLFACGALSIVTTLGIIYTLGHDALNFFLTPEVTLAEFFGTTTWQPQIDKFGIWALVSATITTSAIAILIALPLGIAVAIYLSEYASPRTRSIIKPVLEVLAGIPTVVYGYFALTFMTPLIRNIIGTDLVEFYNTASAGIVIGILILPLISSMSEDALRAVPRALREAAFGLGANKLETAFSIVLPAALSGVTAAVIIGLSRAVGETMIVALAAGAGPNFTFNPFVGAETMTGHIVRISGGDLSYDSLDYNSLFAIGLLLFLLTLVLNIVSRQISRRFRQVYQ